ncbi:MAG TPA: NADH:ubiquinone reductase (Na(+)-transporting) subunit E [Candidatus Omnitrophota bacterium]|nr:NADH:ubiquinone reductase (Na(+)-transporting) subunit E [Candidatus Omnitrophota bacterium]HPB68099.1 NADH:ubiquinone reductase (Na(+)-transporting) subunit E [Candidatus Omnitrophota bacterium]HQO57409.1 NADH:ubiquinone reductase (Na(+)-transporting) subunit E [Candidatus Omnitrophota bacterium]
MLDLINLGIKSVFIENILLAYFLGMCSFLACSKKMETAWGLGLAVIFVMVVTVPVNWAVNHFLLKKGALVWAGLPEVDLSFLRFMAFIAVIAAMVQILEMVIDRVSPKLYAALGIFLPLIAVNCAILGGALFIAEREYSLVESWVFGAGAGAGWALAIVAMAAIRKKLGYSDIPAPLRGLGITLMLTGLMALGFMCFAGIRL